MTSTKEPRFERRWAYSLLTVVAVGAIALLPVRARAEFPDHPIRIIVPFAPGGGSDLIARVMSGPLAEELKQPVIVENHAGANGNIGIGYVAKASPDGYTLLVASSVIFVNKLLNRPSSYDPEKDFSPVVYLGGSPDAIVVRTDSNIKDFADLLKRAKAGHITYSSPGVGSISQLGVELLAVRTGVKLTHVPYTGAGPAAQAALAGTTDVGSVNISATIPLIKAGKLRALVQTGAKRWFELPDVPTVEEAGIGNDESETLQTLMAPAKTPAPVIDKISKAVVKVLARPDIRRHLLKTGFAVAGTGPDALQKLVAEEVGKWREVITAANLKVN